MVVVMHVLRVISAVGKLWIAVRLSRQYYRLVELDEPLSQRCSPSGFKRTPEYEIGGAHYFIFREVGV